MPETYPAKTSVGCAQDLVHDATRDLRALGCTMPIINNLQALDKAAGTSGGLPEAMQEGVLFA